MKIVITPLSILNFLIYVWTFIIGPMIVYRVIFSDINYYDFEPILLVPYIFTLGICTIKIVSGIYNGDIYFKKEINISLPKFRKTHEEKTREQILKLKNLRSSSDDPEERERISNLIKILES